MELSDLDFKVAMINEFKELKENENFSSLKIWEQKSTVADIKNSEDKF